MAPICDSSGLPDPRAEVGALRAFVAVARAGGVARAAATLGRTQPSVSARLSGLEAAWGTRLFERRARGMRLTPEGARLLPLAEAALHRLQELDRLAGLPVSAADELRVGAGDALGRRRLPRALARLLEERPGLEIHLREGAGAALLESLREGEIDLALVVHPGGVLPEGVDLEPWIHSDVHLLAPVGPQDRSGAVPLQALGEERLVTLQPGSSFRSHLERAFAEADVAFRPAVEVGNLSLVRRFVAAGLGVALVPEIAFSRRDSSRLERHEVAGVPPVTYARAVRTQVPLPESARRLLELLGR